MRQEASFVVVVGRDAIVALVPLAVRDVALRTRVHRLERAMAAVQKWAEPQPASVGANVPSLQRGAYRLTATSSTFPGKLSRG